MIRNCLWLLLLFAHVCVKGQIPIFQWAKSFGAADRDYYHDNGRSIDVDAQGNVYTTGLFFQTTDFDPGPGVYNITAQGPNNQAVYVSKLNTNGDFIWARQIPVSLSFADVNLILDKDANVYITSYFEGTVDFDPGPGVFNLTSPNYRSAYVLKLNSSGDFVWVKHFETTSKPDGWAIGTNLTTDENNNVIVCGNFAKTVDVDPGPSVSTLTTKGNGAAFIIKLTQTGQFVWGKQLGDSPDNYTGTRIGDLVCDLFGNVYSTGSFQGNCDFDPGPSSYSFTSAGIGDGFVSKLDPDGNFVWAKQFGNSSGNHLMEPTGIEIDHDGNVHSTGTYRGTQDFDPGPGTSILTTTGYNGYMLKLTSQGDFIWAKVVAEISPGAGGHSADITIDNSNNIYTWGVYTSTSDFDPGPGVFMISNPEAVISKFDPAGNFIYAINIREIDYGGVIPRRIVTDFANNIYVTGGFAGNIDFDPGPDVYTFDYVEYTDAFVMKLSKCLNQTSSTLNISACSNYVLNNRTYNISGTFVQTIPNAAGCDSVITLNLTLNKKSTHQTKIICAGENFFAGGANQTVTGIFKDTLKTVLGCDSIITTVLTVNPKPAPDLGADRDLCENTKLTVTPGNFTSYTWHDLSNNNNYTISQPGLYFVTVTNNFNCTATDSIRINQLLPPPANFLKRTDSVCSNDKLVLQSLSRFNSYQWSTGSDKNNITINTPGEYWLTATDVNGCVGKDTINVSAKQLCLRGVYFPTAFSPNNDGRNDIFKATVRGNLQSFKLQIFDRNGQLIFETADAAKGWDGVNKSIGYSTTTFVWQCFYQLENMPAEFQKGTLMLIR